MGVKKEPRRMPRARHDSVLELRDEKGELIDADLRLVDVSSGGASFSATQTFAVGDVIRGRLRLLDLGVMDITGRVVRVKARTNSILYAVEFDSVKPFRQ